MLGAQHADTQASIHNLTTCLIKQDKQAEAEAMYNLLPETAQKALAGEAAPVIVSAPAGLSAVTMELATAAPANSGLPSPTIDTVAATVSAKAAAAGQWLSEASGTAGGKLREAVARIKEGGPNGASGDAVPGAQATVHRLGDASKAGTAADSAPDRAGCNCVVM